jgi:hypothetical protein
MLQTSLSNDRNKYFLNVTQSPASKETDRDIKPPVSPVIAETNEKLTDMSGKRKFSTKDFNYLRVLGKGSFGKVGNSLQPLN